MSIAEPIAEDTYFDLSCTQLRKDLRAASELLGDSDVRYLVDVYYQRQEARKRSANQARAAADDAEPNYVVSFLADHDKTMEALIKSLLNHRAKQDPTGLWSMSQHGIGPVITAGLLAHIDIEKAPTAGHIWSFAGLTGAKWEKGEKRPWNARLKVLAWHVGQCIKRTNTSPKSFYGPLYQERKAKEIERNEAGELVDQAGEKLAKFKIGKDTEAYKWYSIGKLPPAHLDARACRWVAKLFLSHFHYVLFWHEYGEEPPKPYALEHLGHAHLISPPGFGGKG